VHLDLVHRGDVAVPPLENAAIRAIAAAHGRSAAQVILRWHLQEGRSAIPKSVTPARIAENLDVFDFDLSADELQTIRSLDTGVRAAVDPAVVTPEVIDLQIDPA
jgi:2,5-diketo-D-gluconate reductase A